MKNTNNEKKYVLTRLVRKYKKMDRRKRFLVSRISLCVLLLLITLGCIKGATTLFTHIKGDDTTTVASNDTNGSKNDSSDTNTTSPDTTADSTEADSSDDTSTENTDSTEAADTADTTDTTEAADTADTTDTTDTADSSVSSTSHTLTNTLIDLTSLDGTCQDWGPGSNVDEFNRPYGALQFQEKYASYNANFIVDDTSSNTIYLTFDEGYEYGCTPDILNTLSEKGVRAVFFVTKPYAESSPDLVQRIIDEGHTLGNHSVTHPSAGLPSETAEEQAAEITGVHDYIKENFNYEMHLFRFPAGKFSDQSLAIVNNCNYKSVFWSFAYLDYDVNNQPDETESLQKLMDKLHPGAIYLLHAESWTNTHILGQFIDQARAAGYTFALFD